MEGELGDITMTSSNRKCSAITGSSRKVKDNVADWFNLTLCWNKLNEDGFNMAANIVNIRQSQGDQPMVVQSSSSSAESSQMKLQDECSRLQEVVDKMVAVVKKMERLMTSQRGVGDLDEFQFGPKGRKVPLFHSWTTREFENAAGVLMDAFSQEMKLKQSILREVAHTASADLCLVYLSCWLYQPFIPDQNRLTLEALLLETGHRPL